jgi:hypothetical protein
MGDGSFKASTLIAIKLVESSNVGISMRGIDYHKVGAVRMWSDMYRDHGEYI